MDHEPGQNSGGGSAYGVLDLAGNVSEWINEDYKPYAGSSDNASAYPAGQKVIRGGSFLCHESYCFRYRVAARSSNTPMSTTGHMGFRCAMDT